MSRTVIVSAVRTPIAKLSGGLSAFGAVELGALVIAEAVKRAGVAPEEVDNVLMGTVVQAGIGQIPARQAAIKAGLPVTTSALTINKVCASGLRAITMGDTFLKADEAKVLVAGGMESMTHAPYLLPKARQGYRMGHAQMLDAMIHDGLWCAFDNVHMGVHGTTVSREFGITREEMDAWSARSHQLAAKAWADGLFADEVMSVTVPQGKKDPIQFAQDESIRPETTAESLAKLKPAFGAGGLITAGNAPGVNDGAGALVLMSEDEAKRRGLKPIAAIVSGGMVGDRTPYLHTVPALAIQKAVAKAGLKVSDLGLVEINEAFAAVAIHSTKMLGVSEDIVNVKGGAVAMGHPIGASGARIVAALAYEMQRRGVKYGAAGICSGAAQGDAIVLENLEA